MELYGVGNRNLEQIDRISELLCDRLKIGNYAYKSDSVEKFSGKPTRRSLFDLSPNFMEILDVESRKFISNSTPVKKPQVTVKKLVSSSLGKENVINSMNTRCLVIE